MGGFLGIGGTQQKTNRSLELGAEGNLNNIFNFAMPTAQNLSSAGSSSTGSAQGYWQSILSGNRAANSAAAAPAINSTLAAADAGKRQAAASGTARGGGTAGAQQQVNTNTQATIDNSLFAQRPQAATSLAQSGNAELADAFQALGIGSNAVSQVGSLASGDGTQNPSGSVLGQGASIASSVAGIFGL